MRDPHNLGVHTIRAVRLPLNFTAKQYQIYEAIINIQNIKAENLCASNEIVLQSTG